MAGGMDEARLATVIAGGAGSQGGGCRGPWKRFVGVVCVVTATVCTTGGLAVVAGVAFVGDTALSL